MMRTNDVKFQGQIKVCRCDYFTFLDANIITVDKYSDVEWHDSQLYICVCIGLRAPHPMHISYAIYRLGAQTWGPEISEKCFANRHFVLVKGNIF